MAHYNLRTDNNNLGNVLNEISFFSKEIDYDKKFHEERAAKEDISSFNNNDVRNEELLKIWEQGGSVKIMCLPNFDAYPLYLRNFQKLSCNKLKALLDPCFTIYENEKQEVRVTYKKEDDLRAVYKILKKDRRFNVRVNFDIEDYKINRNNISPQQNKTVTKKDKKLINHWLNNGDVVCETNKPGFSIQIYNFQHFQYDQLVKLFSKYGKFTSIAHLPDDRVQVKFTTEDAARDCYKNLLQYKGYNVRILFFLKELNNERKLVKEILPSEEETYINILLEAEEKIGFVPNKSTNDNYENRRNRRENENEKTEVIKKNEIAVYYPNCKNKNVYVEGTPLHNPYLTPPHSYNVWNCKKNHLPPPPAPTTTSTEERDINYEYYLENIEQSNSSSLSHHQTPSSGSSSCNTPSSERMRGRRFNRFKQH